MDAIAIQVPNQNALNALLNRREVLNIVPDHVVRIEVKPSTPDSPTGLSAPSVTSSAVTLEWTDESTNEEGFRIEGEDSHLLAGLDWIATNYANVTPPIRVVNMSLGRPIEAGDISGPMQQAIQNLYNLSQSRHYLAVWVSRFSASDRRR